MKCLLLIDVQNGFISNKTRDVLPLLNQLAQSVKDYPVFATKFINRGGPFYSIMHWNRLKETPEIDLIPFVEEYAEIVFEKSIYSSCSEEFIGLLRDRSINEVYLAGIDTDCCVLKSAMDLFEHNIRPMVLIDYCASNGGTESHEAAIKVLERNIGKPQIIRGFVDSI